MTMHFHKPNYECSKCSAIFIPYKISIQCPSCGSNVSDEDVKEFLDAISQIAGSMKIHKSMYGTYHPGAWFSSNITDHIQGIVFQLFDALEKENPENEKEFLMSLLEKSFNWGEQQYLKNHIKEIVAEILVIYKAEEFSKIVHVDYEQVETKSGGLKRWFNKFLP